MNLISPWEGLRKPLSRAKRVVFPAPLGPMTPTSSPGIIPKDTVARARNPPKSRERFFTSRSGEWAGAGLSDRSKFTESASLILAFKWISLGGLDVFQTNHTLRVLSRDFLSVLPTGRPLRGVPNGLTSGKRPGNCIIFFLTIRCGYA
jgi:hypothetical protein